MIDKNTDNTPTIRLDVGAYKKLQEACSIIRGQLSQVENLLARAIIVEEPHNDTCVQATPANIKPADLPGISRGELEQILMHPVTDVVMYMHYPLAGFSNGWNRNKYNHHWLNLNDADEYVNESRYTFKSDKRFSDHILIANVGMTVGKSHFPGAAKYMLSEPEYNAAGRYAVGTVVTYNHVTCRYERAPVWFGLPGRHVQYLAPDHAAATGLITYEEEYRKQLAQILNPRTK